MKLFIFGILLLINASQISGSPISLDLLAQQFQNSSTFGKIEDNLLKLVEEFKNRMCHAIPKFGLPVLDPFQFPELEISAIPNFDINLWDINVKGLSDVFIQKLKFSLLLIKFTGIIGLDDLTLRTDYKIKGSIPNLFEIDGEGKMELQIGFTIDFAANLKVDATSKKLSINISKLQPKLTIRKFRITGLFPDDELNKFIQDLIEAEGAVIVDNLWEENKGVAIELLQMLISEPVKDLSIDDLLGMIESDKPLFDESDPEPNCKNYNIFETKIPQVMLSSR